MICRQPPNHGNDGYKSVTIPEHLVGYTNRHSLLQIGSSIFYKGKIIQAALSKTSLEGLRIVRLEVRL